MMITMPTIITKKGSLATTVVRKDPLRGSEVQTRLGYITPPLRGIEVRDHINFQENEMWIFCLTYMGAGGSGIGEKIMGGLTKYLHTSPCAF